MSNITVSSSSSSSSPWADADVLFQLEDLCIKGFLEFGPSKYVRRDFEGLIEHLKSSIVTTDVIEKVEKSRGNKDREFEAWMRVTHARTILKAMECRLQQWFKG